MGSNLWCSNLLVSMMCIIIIFVSCWWRWYLLNTKTISVYFGMQQFTEWVDKHCVYVCDDKICSSATFFLPNGPGMACVVLIFLCSFFLYQMELARLSYCTCFLSRIELAWLCGAPFSQLDEIGMAFVVLHFSHPDGISMTLKCSFILS